MQDIIFHGYLHRITFVVCNIWYSRTSFVHPRMSSLWMLFLSHLHSNVLSLQAKDFRFASSIQEGSASSDRGCRWWQTSDAGDGSVVTVGAIVQINTNINVYSNQNHKLAAKIWIATVHPGRIHSASVLQPYSKMD